MALDSVASEPKKFSKRPKKISFFIANQMEIKHRTLGIRERRIRLLQANIFKATNSYSEKMSMKKNIVKN